MAEPKKTAADTSSSLGSSKGGGALVGLVSLVNFLVTIGLFVFIFITFQREKNRLSLDEVSTEEASHGGGEEKKKSGERELNSESKEHGGVGEKSKEEATLKVKMIDIVPLTINLATVIGSAPKFARVTLSLEPQNAEVEQELRGRLPQVQNIIIDLFNGKKPSELSNVEGREFLKDELKNAINHFLKNGKIHAVYFTNFALSG